MKFKFEDINIGDKVYFESTKLQSNHDLFWEVIGKYEQQQDLVVRLNEMGYTDERWTINISEVKYIEPSQRK
jgi:hypothetical protein